MSERFRLSRSSAVHARSFGITDETLCGQHIGADSRKVKEGITCKFCLKRLKLVPRSIAVKYGVEEYANY